MFGSVARGDARRESDGDLVVVLRNADAAYREVVPALLALRATGPHVAMARRGWYPESYPIFWEETEIDEHVGLLLEIREAGAVVLDRAGILGAALARLDRRIAAGGIRKIVLPGGAYFWDLGTAPRPKVQPLSRERGR